MQGLNYWLAPAVLGKRLDVDKLVDEVCLHFEISKHELTSKLRLRRMVEARGVIGYLLSKYTPMGLVSIGRLLNRHHASVVHYNKKVNGFMDIDEKYKKMVYSFI